MSTAATRASVPSAHELAGSAFPPHAGRTADVEGPQGSWRAPNNGPDQAVVGGGIDVGDPGGLGLASVLAVDGACGGAGEAAVHPATAAVPTATRIVGSLTKTAAVPMSSSSTPGLAWP